MLETNDRAVEELSTAQAQTLEDDLTHVWTCTFGGPPRQLIPDLSKLKRMWFGPRVAPSSLRERIERIPDTNVARSTLRFDPPVVMPVRRGHVVTPEGRLALEQLIEQRGATCVRLHVSDHPLLSELYRGWTQEKLHAAVDALEGRGEPMYPVSIAAVIVLLCHGADSESTALVIPRAPHEDIVGALREPLEEAAAHISGGENAADDRQARFEGYPIGRARTRLGGDTVMRKPSRGSPVALWVPASEHKRVLDVVAEELVSRRRGMSLSDAAQACTAIVAAYRRAYPVLECHGLARGTAVNLDDLEERLHAALRFQATAT